MSQDENYSPIDWILGEPLDHRGPVMHSDDPLADDPVGEFVAKCADLESLHKNSGAASGVDPVWLEEVGVAEPERTSGDLSKAASAPGRIRQVLEKHGEETFAVRYDHEGQIVSMNLWEEPGDELRKRAGATLGSGQREWLRKEMNTTGQTAREVVEAWADAHDPDPEVLESLLDLCDELDGE
jgi:hypothetical protein